MAAASVNTPIKDTVGATFSAGFDITAKTAIDGRMTVQTTSDLTDSRAWQSKSGTAAAPEYWLYNGLFTSVADTGKLYVLAGIDETLPKTIWPNPAAPGTTASGPRWVEAGGTDSFLKEAYIVDAKYGYVTSSQEYAAYYEPDYEHYDRVYEDRALTTLATEKKYLKMVVTQAGGSGIITNVIYCDVQDLIKNVGRTLTIYGQGVLAASFDGTADRSLNLTGSENIEVTAAAGAGINFGLVWQALPHYSNVTVYIDGVETVVDSDLDWGTVTGGSVYSQDTYNARQGETPSTYDISSTNPEEGQSVYTTCVPAVHMITANVDGVATSVDEYLTWNANLGGSVYSQNTYDPNQGETPSTYDISNTYPTEGQSVYTACTPIVVVPTVYWYGNTNAGDRNPDDTSFVSANPSTGTSTSYKIRPITMSSGPLNINIPEYNSGYGRGYQLNNNNRLSFELNGQNNVVIIVQSSGSSARNLTLTLPDGSTQTIVAVPSGNTDPTNVIITKPAMTGTCTISNAGGGAVVVGYIGAYKA